MNIPHASAVPLFLDLAAERLDCPSFGLRLGHIQDLSLFGPLALSIRNAITIRDLIHNLAELFPLHTQGAVVGVAEDAGEILLTFELSADVYPSHRQVVELGFGLLVGEIRRHSPGWQPPHITFRHTRPSDIRWHRRLLGEQLLFDAESNALLFDGALLSQSLAPSDTDPSARKESHRATLRHTDLIPFHTERLVRASLPSRLLTVAEAARLLRMSKRSLQRRLMSANTSFDAIVDSVRSDLAFAYLRDSRLTVAQVAEILHFSETSALSRAVRRWYAQTPRMLRQSATPRPLHI
ncbi:AraC family transcriptional regulator [Sphingopyxis sp. JAI108]|uniref:AraC family transcriptional regulator n=1 Tax=Sphingopyxis sp. JAI108 TaxID=2723060 RepID=UPI0015CE26A8|nr:AraC family transcriptional regulator [Sphingopyxis sp. JAI108]NYF32619.1 AraC-like DNA-binding protein [Sphingopyxis sp. JAI108]